MFLNSVFICLFCSPKLITLWSQQWIRLKMVMLRRCWSKNAWCLNSNWNKSSTSICHTNLTHELCHMFYLIIFGLDLSYVHSSLFIFIKEWRKLQWLNPARSSSDDCGQSDWSVYRFQCHWLSSRKKITRPPDTGSTTFNYGGLRLWRWVYWRKIVTEWVQSRFTVVCGALQLAMLN